MKEEYFYVLQFLLKGEWVDLTIYPETHFDCAKLRRDDFNTYEPNLHRIMWRKVTTEDITEIK